ncbi:hypothetical protein CI266_005121 [Salmonella enterica subsp. enterica serovar Kotte]|nr:hypothetical protein [Salmonella enterica subsp. enterica serovar Kotte]
MSRYDDIYKNFIKNITINDYVFFDEEINSYVDDGKMEIRNSISSNAKNSSGIIMFENLSDMYLDALIDRSFKGQKYNNQYLCDFVFAKSMEVLPIYIQSENFENYEFRPSQIGISLLVLIACKQIDVVEKLYDGIINSITDGTVRAAINNGDEPPVPQKLFILLTEMLTSERKQTVDWGRVGIPVERFYCDFVREALYETDEVILTKWLTGLCDQHLKWCSRFPAVSREASFLGYEIRVPVHLWPFEYHAVKNFRARHGLSTPEIEHPLMKTIFSDIPTPDFSQWQKPEWFTEICDMIFEFNPDVAFVKEIFLMKNNK